MRTASGAATISGKLSTARAWLQSCCARARDLDPSFENVAWSRFEDLQLNREFELLLTNGSPYSGANLDRSGDPELLGLGWNSCRSVGSVALSYLFHPFRPRFD